MFTELNKELLLSVPVNKKQMFINSKSYVCFHLLGIVAYNQMFVCDSQVYVQYFVPEKHMHVDFYS